MLASSNFNNTKSIVSPINTFKHKPGRNSHPTCLNPFIFLLLFYDTQATSHSIIEIGVLGIITSVRSDGWGLTNAPDHGFVALFDCDGPYSVDITSGQPMYQGNPTSQHLVLFSLDMATCVELYARTEWNNDVFELGKGCLDTDLKDFFEEDEEADTRCSLWTSSGQDGCVRMYYILLKDVVDFAIKVTYDRSTKDGGGEVFA